MNEPTQPGAIIDGKQVKQAIPLRGIRRTLAVHMQRSLQETAQMSGTFGVDMTAMIEYRNSLNSKENETGIHYTWTDIFVKIAVEALKQVPIINASLIEKEIIIWDDINIGVALDFEMRDGGRGLIVPVLRNADNKSIAEIHNDLELFKGKGRDGKLMPDDTTGGTFTVTNSGALGDKGSPKKGIATGMIMASTPILNMPQAGIWSMYPYSDAAVVVDGQVVVRPVMYSTITVDHRIVNGADRVAFMNALQQAMLNPDSFM